MKRFSMFAMAAMLTAGLSMPAFSQAKKADPCAQYKTAPKGEKAADKKSRMDSLKKCQADAKMKSQPAKKGGK